jgi:hypothetical protein
MGVQAINLYAAKYTSMPPTKPLERHPRYIFDKKLDIVSELALENRRCKILSIKLKIPRFKIEVQDMVVYSK